ncbi:MAG: DUF2867 domain-containing protein, partial [Bacteroidota bacterium]
FMKIIRTPLPKNSILNTMEFEYFDSYQGYYFDGKDQVGSEDIGKAFFSSAPGWTAKLFALRNKMVSFFGLKIPEKTNNREELLKKFKCEPGERLGLFSIYHKTADEVVLGEDDKHLNFRVSLYKEPIGEEEGKKGLTISTIVKFNNWFGKLYFLPVKPFHKLIVPRMLKGILEQLEMETKTSC